MEAPDIDEPEPSPRIESVSWGRLQLEDGRAFKDAKLFPGGAREWDWTETGTHHDPGIQPADVTELLDAGVTAVVLSRGFHERLDVRADTLDLLESRGVAARIHPTEEAARVYNDLRESHAVGGLFHSTC